MFVLIRHAMFPVFVGPHRVYFRSIERMLFLAMNYPSPGIEARLMVVKPHLVSMEGFVEGDFRIIIYCM